MLPYKVVFPESSLYPANLKRIDGHPKRLYIAGEVIDKDRRAIAIIGSRRMTDYGKKVAWEFAYYLAGKGITIVSGMARGIDTIAHKAALFIGGRTIAVLGSGIDVIYPPENTLLARTVSQNGAVITEFPPGTPPYGRNFLSRNRLISGLSIATLVVEGARRSGTLSISNWAANQGKDVFAIPGRIDSPLSALPNYLIENGAIAVTSPEDILDIIR